ncbi:hypothetical protein AI2618V1_1784 [Serratia marcescens]|nr:hypothetical protein SK68_02313 [Serratia marcescens]KMJ12597.1 hypothetical protein SN03_02181 [Serratia marcescens]CAB1209138.1 hypothetical protein FB6_0656 [Serratia marcescens]CAE7297234.1 hypothetical protein AI2618V1_1784 [Serratia marcescens]CAE7297307.1 hypothetical protein AI2617V1_1777 [Serratia marcescens]
MHLSTSLMLAPCWDMGELAFISGAAGVDF